MILLMLSGLLGASVLLYYGAQVLVYWWRTMGDDQ